MRTNLENDENGKEGEFVREAQTLTGNVPTSRNISFMKVRRTTPKIA